MLRSDYKSHGSGPAPSDSDRDDQQHASRFLVLYHVIIIVIIIIIIIILLIIVPAPSDSDSKDQKHLSRLQLHHHPPSHPHNCQPSPSSSKLYYIRITDRSHAHGDRDDRLASRLENPNPGFNTIFKVKAPQ